MHIPPRPDGRRDQSHHPKAASCFYRPSSFDKHCFKVTPIGMVAPQAKGSRRDLDRRRGAGL
jgi:hypothetical protein